MLVASKCLHRVVAREYADTCREDPSFHDFLLTILPDMQLDRCSGCGSNNPGCAGEFLEYHPDPDNFLLELERARLGFCEDPSYGPTGMTKRGRYESSVSSGRSIDLKKALPVNLELLTGDSRIDRFQVAADRKKHSQDDYSVQEEFDECLRVA